MIDTRAEAVFAGHIGNIHTPVPARTALAFRLLALVAAALAALLPLAIVLYWSMAGMDHVVQQAGFAPEVLPDLNPVMRIGAALISLAAVSPLAWGLMRVRVCFTEFAAGRPFTARGTAGLRDFAAGIGIAALAKPIGYTLLTLLLSWNAPAGMRQLAIQIDSDALIMALFAATVASLAWAMERAAAIAEENSQFV